MWYLEKLTARGGLLGTTGPNTFEGHRFPVEEDLPTRETVHNTKDNPLPKAKPRVVFRHMTLTGAAKVTFLKTISLKELYANKSLLAKAPSFSELRNIGNDAPLGLLYIEDFGTTEPSRLCRRHPGLSQAAMADSRIG